MTGLAPSTRGFGMSAIPNGITVSAAGSSQMFLATTVRANLVWRPDGRMTAVARAILGNSVGGSAAIELFATMGTSECATGDTENGTGPTGHECLSALPTDLGGLYNRKPSIASKLRMVTTELLLHDAVADRAHSNEIR